MQTILVVDDEPGMREVVADILEAERYCVLQASSADEALLILDLIKPDLIVSDIVMGAMDGFAFCKCVRDNAELSQLPFVFLTAMSNRSDVRTGMGLGADDYLVKPFEPEELTSTVRARLARAAAARALVDKDSVDLKRMIVRVLAHELRTPLALTYGYTELLESMGAKMSDEDLHLILHGLKTGNQRLRQISEDTITLSRIVSGVLVEEIRRAGYVTAEPDLAVRNVAQQFQDSAFKKGVSLDLRLETPGASVCIHSASLKEIVHKLLDNAIRFSKKEGGLVLLSTRQEGDSWVLAVVDDGIGIRHEAFGWIFEAFRQMDRDVLEQQGAGLGLAIVRGLTEAYGGGVTVDSEPGKGSRFTVRLPLAG